VDSFFGYCFERLEKRQYSDLSSVFRNEKDVLPGRMLNPVTGTQGESMQTERRKCRQSEGNAVRCGRYA
jgi:hypothetical protein